MLFIRVQKKGSALGLPVSKPLYFLYFPVCILFQPILENCLQLSFVNQTTQHVTVNLVLFEIDF